MKGLFVLALLVCSASEGWAQASGQWNIVAETEERVFTRSEFVNLQEKYPQYFDRYDPSTVRSAAILLRKLRYFGPTMCHRDDPRLQRTVADYKVCYLPHAGGGCSGFNSRPPAPHDPCF